MPLVLEFPVPNVPLSENQSRRMHWAARARELEPWKNAVAWAWMVLPVATREHWTGKPCEVLVELPFARGGRRDPHNYIGTNVKALVDALVTKTEKVGALEIVIFEGIWPDDTPEWVTVIEPKLVHPSETARVILTERES